MLVGQSHHRNPWEEWVLPQELPCPQVCYGLVFFGKGFGGFWKRASVFAGNSFPELKFYRCFNQGQTCLCEQDMLAPYQVFKRSPWLSGSALETK